MKKTRGKAGCLEIQYTPEEEAKHRRRRIREAMLPALADLLLAMDDEDDPAPGPGGKKLKAATPTGPSRDSLKSRVKALRNRLRALEP